MAKCNKCNDTGKVRHEGMLCTDGKRRATTCKCSCQHESDLLHLSRQVVRLREALHEIGNIAEDPDCYPYAQAKCAAIRSRCSLALADTAQPKGDKA